MSFTHPYFVRPASHTNLEQIFVYIAFVVICCCRTARLSILLSNYNYQLSGHQQTFKSVPPVSSQVFPEPPEEVLSVEQVGQFVSKARNFQFLWKRFICASVPFLSHNRTQTQYSSLPAGQWIPAAAVLQVSAIID